MYQLPNKFIAFDTGLSIEQVQSLKEQFKQAGKIDFDGDVIWVKKMREYQDSGDSPKVAVRIIKDLQALPNCRIKGIYCDKYGIDRVSVGYLEKESDTDTDTDTEKKQRGSAHPNKFSETPVIIWKRITGQNVPVKLHEMVCDGLTSTPDENKLKTVFTTWIGRGYKPNNIVGILEWYKTGIPTQNGNKVNGRGIVYKDD